ncbi:glycoside hydrolase family 2 protein [Polymorphum gilvum]|uniref:Glycosyl hydrolases family 2, immunoglobulin-like beta-sandwich domain n=1 Tax=Polymorphum gilvum (strain LMG 25793 / CGMCC 1.9160 / SL003B-26A1) TaxID=991905 RepID=F2IXJ7_POLGS|nr:glycoside hydrolase family 2 TIM barrel-domain containing protein [Polymorphum gilvum]ADZ71620.1 Glycosyl hydrolases family 2, immunoglobulin-like beta-sandwich domain [Polymorphum gilvum SL003B-26A1]
MLERSTLAENALQALHDEDYDVPFNTQSLNHSTMIFTGGRPARSLAGEWNFCVDLLDTGLRQKWFAMRPEPAEERVEPWDYDPYQGETVPVPSCWQMLKEKWYFFEGSAWYTRALDMEEIAADRRYFLRVGAAQYDCKVFLNGVFLGNHYGGSTPFCAELTGHLEPGRNWLMLVVNNTRTLDRVPMRNTDWFNYGGIYREVELFETPATVIRDLFVHLVPDGSYARIRAEVAVDGDARDAVLRLPALGVEAVVPLDADGRGEIVIDAQPDLWSPETPVLHDVELTAGGDRVADRVGFRQIERVGDEIRLNGRPLFLRGISVHEDDRKAGKVTDEADLRRRFAHARDLNCNYLRLAHYPHHELAAKLADELGFLLWEEIPVYWAIAFDNPATYRDAENQLCELIKRDRNRASVIIWSVGNENPDTDARLSFMRRLVETAKRLDPTRLTSAACLINHARNRIEDRLAEHIDVIGINEYYGWYEENFEDLAEIGRNSDPGKPVVISETGADGAIGDGGPRRGLFSEDYMTKVYERQIETLRPLSYVKGMSPWILYDFRVERRQNVFQGGFNRKGLIAADKATKKTAFAVLANYYAERRDSEGGGGTQT